MNRKSLSNFLCCWRRALILGVGIIGIAWVAWWVHQYLERERAITEVRELGGYFAEGQPTYPRWTNQPRAVLGDRLLAPLAKPAHYKRVDLWFKPATDADLERLASITDLTQIDLCGTRITDNGLAHLSGLTKLESLELAYTQVTDAGLTHLKKLTRLERLRLEQCNITDAAIPHLQAIAHDDLYVNLRETKVTSIQPGELMVGPVDGDGEMRVGQTLVFQGTCKVSDPTYVLNEINIGVIGQEEDSDEASHFGSGTCTPTRRRDGSFHFEIELPAPDRPGQFKVEASTCAKLHGFRAFYTAGLCRITVLPALGTVAERR